jgi:dihydrolipoamide dehydrogenase
MLPLSLSYDHRVIDGANGARFTSCADERAAERRGTAGGGQVSSAPILCPDLGNFKDVEVIEVLVKAGDRIEAETPLITLETDKATMDVPSPQAGTWLMCWSRRAQAYRKGSPLVNLEAAGRRGRGPPAPGSTAAAGAAPAPARSPGNFRPAPAKPAGGHRCCGAPKAPMKCRPIARCSCWCSAPGPGGYTAAFRAADLGSKVTLIERWERSAACA